jgi:lipopolysaccharide export system protein LptA
VFKLGPKLLIYWLSIGLFITCLCTTGLAAQDVERVKLERADYLENGSEDGVRFDKVIGNVLFTQKETRIYGDSAFFFKNQNLVKIFGRVRILEGDSITITGGRLIYLGDEKLAQMRENVVYRDPSMTLTTDFLDYDMVEHLAYYYEDGRLVTETNTLTSKKGYYDTDIRFASFKDSVVLRNQDYLVEADTFQFNTVTEVAYFLGPTVITANDGTVLNADDGGVYRTRENISNFSGAAIETPTYLLYGDELFGDRSQEYYTATSNVSFISKEEDIIITGDHGRYWKDKGLTKVYGNALMKKIFITDTLYLSADTLISLEDSIPSNERLLAFNNVKIFKPDLQGKADSLSYRMADSLMYLYDDPVLWNEDSQMESDTISMIIANGQIDRMFLDSKAFVTSLTTEDYYNQVKGRKMVAHFKQSKLNQVDVNGNGESIYFEVEEEDSLVMGMNKVLCSDMRLKFKEQKLTDITFYSPDGSFIPFHEIKPESTKLEGFSWREHERPTRYSVLGSSQETPSIVPDNPPLPSNVKPVEVDVGAPRLEKLQKLQQN